MKQIEFIRAESSQNLELWDVKVDNILVFKIRFELWSLLTSTYYVRMIEVSPEHVTLGVLRAMAKRFKKLEVNMYCQCENTQPNAERFAAFFGFKTKNTVGNRVHMERYQWPAL